MRANFLTVKQALPLLLATLTATHALAQTGNVGIGTPTPSDQLHTTGTVRHQGYSGAGTRLVQMDSSGRMVVTGGGPTFSNNTSAAILDDGCSTGVGALSTITVTGMPTAVAASKISVRVNITHAYLNDLVVYLVSPGNLTLTLAAGIGGTGDNFRNTYFSDAAVASISAGVAPYTGTFRPLGGTPSPPCIVTQYVANFGQFNFGSIVPNGTWTLRVFDRVGGDAGTLDNWSISFSGPESIATAEQANYIPYFAGGGLEASPLYRAPSGNLGIGTTTPAQKLDISKGRLRFSGDPAIGAISQGIEFTNGTGTALNGFVGTYNDSMIGLYGYTGAGWRFLFNNTNGNVGLQGNSNPRAPLSFASSIGNKIALWGNADGGHYGLGISAAALQIYGSDVTADILLGYGSSAAFTENMRVKGNGNVGIGTNNPQYKLDVSGDFRATSNASVQGSVQVGGGVIANTVQVQGGSPAVGKVLTATSASGDAVWQTVSAGRDAFRASQTSGTTPLNSLALADNNTSLDFDDENRYNNTTQKFTAAVSGLYSFQYSVFFTSLAGAPTTSGICELKAFKNSTAIDDIIHRYEANEFVNDVLNGSVIVKLNAGDVVFISATASSANISATGLAGAGNYFSGYRIN